MHKSEVIFFSSEIRIQKQLVYTVLPDRVLPGLNILLFPSIENAQNKGQKKKKGPVGVQAWAVQSQPQPRQPQPQPRNDPAVVHVGSVVPLRPTARMSTGGTNVRPRPVQPHQPQNDPAVVYVGHVPFPLRPPILNRAQTIPIRPVPLPNTTQTTQQSRRARVIQPRNGRPIMAISAAVQPQQNGPSVIQTRSQPQQNGPSGPHTRAQPQRGGPSAGSNGPTTNATRPSDAFA